MNALKENEKELIQSLAKNPKDKGELLSILKGLKVGESVVVFINDEIKKVTKRKKGTTSDDEYEFNEL